MDGVTDAAAEADAADRSERLAALARALRTALPTHRDGARLFAGTGGQTYRAIEADGPDGDGGVTAGGPRASGPFVTYAHPGSRDGHSRSPGTLRCPPPSACVRTEIRPDKLNKQQLTQACRVRNGLGGGCWVTGTVGGR
ncbi:TetR/AcrR family transcriptional regulator C-terminal domain-containing protein [Streptomyces violascens]|uniref:TetR/AcrR family transcriptional regulator C-terminal domain-containing protein n=1 Tax=Streptomyces violascens TaxID=67381 RepID=UPI0036618728